MKSFSWVSFSIFIIVAAIAGIFDSNYNFFPTNDEGTLRSYLIKATEDPSFVAGMSKTFQKIYKEKGIYPTEDQIGLTNECLKNEIFTQLINSKETSIKTHLDEKYKIKSTSDWKQLFNSEIMGKYGDTLKGIVRSCQELNIEEEITKDLPTELPVEDNNSKGLICGENYYLIDIKNETVKSTAAWRLDWTEMFDDRISDTNAGYRMFQPTPDEITFIYGYSENNRFNFAYKYRINRKTLSLRTDYCEETDDEIKRMVCHSSKPTITQCEVFPVNELMQKVLKMRKNQSKGNKI